MVLAEQTYRCTACGSYFYDEVELAAHSGKAHLAAAEAYKCALCGRDFHEEDDLAAHCGKMHYRQLLFVTD